MASILEMIVNIDCPGCEKKVKKALQNLDGVDNVDIDMDLQKVTVTGEAEQEKILKTVRKTGKKADLWPSPSSNNPDHEYTSTEYFSNRYNYHSHPSSYFSSDHSSTSTDHHHHLHEHHSHQNGNNYNNGPKYEYEYGVREYDRGNYNHPSPSILGRESTTMFSDENVNACSIM